VPGAKPAQSAIPSDITLSAAVSSASYPSDSSGSQTPPLLGTGLPLGAVPKLPSSGQCPVSEQHTLSFDERGAPSCNCLQEKLRRYCAHSLTTKVLTQTAKLCWLCSLTGGMTMNTLNSNSANSDCIASSLFFRRLFLPSSFSYYLYPIPAIHASSNKD